MLTSYKIESLVNFSCLYLFIAMVILSIKLLLKLNLITTFRVSIQQVLFSNQYFLFFFFLNACVVIRTYHLFLFELIVRVFYVDLL